jgi:CMP-N-acetylneuraminic acid synthetase
MDLLDIHTMKLNNLLSELTFVIPARVNSSRIPKKVLQKLEMPNGDKITLLDLKIQNLLKLTEPQKIILSSGEDELIDIGNNYGIMISRRSEEFFKAGYQTTTRQSINEVIKDVKTKYTAWTPPVVPFHDSKCIRLALNYYCNNCNPASNASLTTIVHEKAYYWYKNLPLNYSPDENHVQSQYLEPLQKITNGLYLAKTEDMRLCGYYLTKDVVLYEVDIINGVDIDNMHDLVMAQQLSKMFYTNDM